MQATLKGYVNSVRNNTLASGKEVTNVSIACSLGKNKEGKVTYQKVDVAFWNESAVRAKDVPAESYVCIPDALLTEFSTSESNGKTYINIKAMARDIFVATGKKETNQTNKASQIDAF